MNTAKLNDWIQVVGIFAVVASLIFVGFQMKQAQNIAIASQYQERSATLVEYYVGREQSDIQSRLRGERLIRSWGVPPGMDENVSAAEAGSEHFYARAGLVIFENLHFQYISGFYTEASWAGSRWLLKRAINHPSWKSVVKNYGHAYRSDFRELCEELIAENQAETR